MSLHLDNMSIYSSSSHREEETTVSAKTFSVKRENKPGIHVTGFPANGHHAFVNLKVGDSQTGGEFSVILYLADARALQSALENAINHAELGLMDEAA